MHHLVISILFYVLFFLYDGNQAVHWASFILAGLSFMVYIDLEMKKHKNNIQKRTASIEQKSKDDLKRIRGFITGVVEDGYSYIHPEHHLLYIETEDGRELKGYCKKSAVIRPFYETKETVTFYYEEDIIVYIER